MSVTGVYRITIPNPKYDPVLKDKNIDDILPVLQSDNPNIEISFVERPNLNSDDPYIPCTIAIREKTPLFKKWIPRLHTGYYYYKDEERYLYAECNVFNKSIDIKMPRLKRFGYTVKAKVFIEGQLVDDEITVTDIQNIVVLEQQDGVYKLPLITDNNGNYITSGFIEFKEIELPDIITSIRQIIPNVYLPDLNTSVDVMYYDYNEKTYKIFDPAQDNNPHSNKLKIALRVNGYVIDKLVEEYLYVETLLDEITLNNTIQTDTGIVINNLSQGFGEVYSPVIETAKEIVNFNKVKLGVVNTDLDGRIDVFAKTFDNPDDEGSVTWISCPFLGNNEYDLTVSPKKYLKLRIVLNAGRNIVPQTYTYDIKTGQFLNTIYDGTGIRIDDQNEDGVFVSNPIDLAHPYLYSLNYLKLQVTTSNNNSYEVYTITDNNLTNLLNRSNNLAEWKKVGPDGKIYSPTARYIRFRIVFKNAETLGNTNDTVVTGVNLQYSITQQASPVLQKIFATANVNEKIMVSPEVIPQITCKFTKDVGAKDYSVSIPLIGEILTDGKYHVVYKDNIEEYIKDVISTKVKCYKTKINVTNLEFECLDSKIDIGFNINGQYEISAKSLEYNTEITTVNTKIPNIIYVYNVDNEWFSITTPAPKQGAPVIVKDTKGYLTRVDFIDKDGNPTLENTETVTIRANTNYAVVSYTGIDKSSVVSDKFKVLDVVDNRIVFDTTVLEDTRVTVKYKIDRSFTVIPYFHEDFTKIIYHNVSPDINNCVNVFYETSNSDTISLPYINLNPLFNPINEGFIFLSKTRYEPVDIDIHISPDELNTNYGKEAFGIVIVKDLYGNPVPNVKANISANLGKIVLYSNTTDEFGQIAFAYIFKPINDGSVFVTDTITVTVNNRLVKTVEYRIKQVETAAILTMNITKDYDYYTSYGKKCFKLRITGVVRDIKFNPVKNAPVTITIYNGVKTETLIAMTNSKGVYETVYDYKGDNIFTLYSEDKYIIDGKQANSIDIYKKLIVEARYMDSIVQGIYPIE